MCDEQPCDERCGRPIEGEVGHTLTVVWIDVESEVYHNVVDVYVCEDPERVDQYYLNMRRAGDTSPAATFIGSTTPIEYAGEWEDTRKAEGEVHEE